MIAQIAKISKIEYPKKGTFLDYVFYGATLPLKLAGQLITYPVFGSFYHKWQEKWAKEAGYSKNTFTFYSLIAGALSGAAFYFGLSKILSTDLPSALEIVKFPAYVKMGLIVEGYAETIGRAIYTITTKKPIGTILVLPWESLPFLIKVGSDSINYLEHKLSRIDNKNNKKLTKIFNPFNFLDPALADKFVLEFEKLFTNLKQNHVTLEEKLKEEMRRIEEKQTRKIRLYFSNSN